MTRIKIIGALALSAGLAATCAAVFAQQGPPPRSLGESPRGDVEREIMKLEQEWADAIVNRDRAVVDRIIADDILLTDPTGQTWDRAEYLAELSATGFGAESSEMHEIAVHVYAGAAVVSARVTIRKDAAHADASGRYRSTDTYVRRGGVWRCVAAHSVRLGEGSARPTSPALSRTTSSNLFFQRDGNLYPVPGPLLIPPPTDRPRSEPRPR